MTTAQVFLRPGHPDEADALARLHVALWRGADRGYALQAAFDQLDEAMRACCYRMVGQEIGLFVDSGRLSRSQKIVMAWDR